MAVFDLTFPSSNGRDDVRAWVHTPVAERPRGLVQIVHGFGEHARRYLPLVSALLDAGYAVALDDHLGHGTTAVANDSWGDSGGADPGVFVSDEAELALRARAIVPDVPFLVFGHSWGSMIMRAYLAECCGDVAGAVLCGTPAGMLGIAEGRDHALAQIHDEGAGAVDSGALALMLGPLNRRYGSDATPIDWVSGSPAVLADYVSDPLNLGQRPVTAGFAASFAALYERVDGAGRAARVPHELPVLLIAGEEDPVGDWGEGVRSVADDLVAAGHPAVTTRLWAGVRHEVHNEPDVRDEVFAVVIEFFDEVTAARPLP